MATRIPENSLVDSYTSKSFEPVSSTQNCLLRKKLDDIAREEKESCGSNEVSVHFDNTSTIAEEERKVCKPAKNRLKARRNMSKRKTVPSCLYAKECTKVGNHLYFLNSPFKIHDHFHLKCYVLVLWSIYYAMLRSFCVLLNKTFVFHNEPRWAKGIVLKRMKKTLRLNISSLESRKRPNARTHHHLSNSL